ncbi:N domain-containingdehydrogenase [Trichoderma cornu-damae]|uniref:N domain-containingdehydrogenase n=1 Tax=Trichoderma cornu-damae TaxID=654480 RepID=A0A9P8TTW4_9HYPO|nr:N domain-containingdehydrogenase [Trichoderma cornu-damae]
MHIFISGATGRNGRLALGNALSRGHTVTVLARDPSSLPPHPNLTIIKDVQTALSAPTTPSAILTTINQRRTTENPFSPLSPDSPPDLLASTAQVLLLAIASTPFGRPPKVIVNSLHGATDSFASLGWLFRCVLSRSTMNVTLRDHNNMDKLIRDSGVPFVLARPARLTNGPAKKVKVLPDNGQGCGWNAVISRASVAEWMVEAAETNDWDGRSPVLTN